MFIIVINNILGLIVNDKEIKDKEINDKEIKDGVYREGLERGIREIRELES